KLYAQLCKGKHGCFASRSYEDIFEDTIIYIIRDPKALTLSRDADIIDLFIKRYRMIEFQTIKDSIQNKEVHHAYPIQAEEEQAE
ncbi:MAG: hypothetical protein RR220_04145, partial [Bacteroidaceae bacterium]